MTRILFTIFCFITLTIKCQTTADPNWYLLSVRVERFDGVSSTQDIIKESSFQAKKINHSGQDFSSAFGAGVHMLTNPILKYKKFGLFPHIQVMYNQFTSTTSSEKINSGSFNFGTYTPIPLNIKFLSVCLNVEFGPRYFFACTNATYSQNIYFEYGGGLMMYFKIKAMNYALPIQFQWKNIHNEQYAFIGLQFPFMLFADKSKYKIANLFNNYY